MIARKLRTLRPGTEYNRLITPSLGGYLVRLDNADTADTLKLIQEVIKKTLSQTLKLAPTLRGSSLNDTCKNIWMWVYTHIQYKEDRRGHEEIRHPSRIWADRVTGVDCDDYTVMISSILTHLGIPHKLRMTDYGTGKGWQHIYVVVPKDGNAKAALSQANRTSYITLDCVTDRFDHEVHYVKNQDIAMTLNELNGPPVSGLRRRNHSVNGLGHTNLGYYPETDGFGNIFQKIGKAVKSVAQGIKKAATTPIRLGILASMKLNFPKGADKYRFGYLPYGPIVAKAGYGPEAHKKIVDSLKKLIKTFVGLGGDHKVLFTTIINSSGNKDGLVPKDTPNPEAQEGFHGMGGLAGDPDWEALQQITSLQSRVTGVAGLEGLSGGGLGELGIVAETTIAAAAAVLVPIIKMMTGAKANDPADPVPDLYQEEDPADDANAVEAATADGTTADTSTNGFYGLGAAAKKKAVAAKRVTTVVAKQAAKGKPVPAAAKKAAAKAKSKAPVKVNSSAPLKLTNTLKTSQALVPLPSKLPGVTADGRIPVSAMTPAQKKAKVLADKKAAKKAKPGIIKKTGTAIKNNVKKVGTGIKTLVDKKKAKAKVKKNAKDALKAKAAGDHETAQKLAQENAKIVQETVNVDATSTSDNTGVVRQTPGQVTPSEDENNDWLHLTDPVSTGESSSQQKVQAAITVMDKTQKAVEKGAMAIEQGKQIYDRASDAIKTATGKSLPGSSPAKTTDTDTDDGYDAHEVVDSASLPTDPATPTSTQASMGTMIGIGVGALLLSSLLFGNNGSQATVRPRAVSARGLNGFPKGKSKKKTGKPTSRKRKVHSRVSLQD